MANHRPFPATPHDVAPIVDMVRRHEGDESADLATRHLQNDLGACVVIRGATGDVEGFVYLASITARHVNEDRFPVHDPAVEAALSTLRTTYALRPGDGATLFRFWMSRDHYQGVSGVQSALFAVVVRHYLVADGLAVTLFPVADPEFWTPALEYADLTRIETGNFTVSGRSYAVFGHDWRVMPPSAWLGMLAARETSERLEPPAERGEPLIVLAEPDLRSATIEALRHYNDLEALAENPLIRSRVVIDRASPQASQRERIDALREIVKDCVDRLGLEPKGPKQHKAVYHTFINPAPSQEAAAEAAGIPFSTYRRHLAAGRDAVAKRIWQLDLGER